MIKVEIPNRLKKLKFLNRLANLIASQNLILLRNRATKYTI
jgi:hypothetical protein